ncbi:MAG: DUF3164 family protein [Bacteroidales bacterium]|nr:DUF3164 family protein [Bacteroidales bacterium]
MNLENLTPEEKAKLLEELKQEEKAKQEKVKEDRKLLKELAGKEVEEMFNELTMLSSQLSATKTKVFSAFENLIKMKCELYEVKSEQQSHTFSNKEGTKRIKLGYRVYDRYDDTVEEGIAKVREYVDSLIKDEDTALLVGMINRLLKKDAKGNLKANRVLDLIKMSEETDSKLFKDGVQIIVDAYRPERSSDFIEAEWKDERGNWNSVALSISSAPFLESK